MQGTSTTLTAAASACVIHSEQETTRPVPSAASDDERRHASDRRRQWRASRIADGMGRRRQPRGPNSRHYGVPSDEGGRRAANIYTLIETARLNDVDPEAWLADVIGRVADHPNTKIDELLLWKWSGAGSQAIAA